MCQIKSESNFNKVSASFQIQEGEIISVNKFEKMIYVLLKDFTIVTLELTEDNL